MLIQNKILQKIKSVSLVNKVSFAAGFIACLAFNIYAYTNTPFVGDGVAIYDSSNGIAGGRFLAGPMLDLFSNRLSAPWGIGLINCLIMGFIAVAFCKALHVKNPFWAGILSCFIAGNHSLIYTHLYFSSVCIYSAALLLATMSYLFLQKGKIKESLLAVLFMILSLSMYQGYLCIPLILIVIDQTRAIRNNNSAKQIAKKTIHMVGTILVAVLLYYAVWQLIMIIGGVEATGYRGRDSFVQNIFSDFLLRLVNSFYLSLKCALQSYSIKQIGIFGFVAISALSVTAMVLLFVNLNFARKTQTKKSALPYIATIAFLLILPPCISVINIIEGKEFHLLLQFGYITPLLIFVQNIDEYEMNNGENKTFVNWATVILSFILIFSQFKSANAYHIKVKTQYDAAVSLCTRIIDRIENTEGYEPGMDVVFVITREPIYKSYDWSEGRVDDALGNTSLGYPDVLPRFFNQELSTPIKIIIDDGTYEGREEIQNINVFPEPNCTTQLDGKIIIKTGYFFNNRG